MPKIDTTLTEAEGLLLGLPVEGQVDAPHQLGRGEVCRLSATDDGLDDLRREKRQRQDIAGVAIVDPLTGRQLGNRCHAAGQEGLEAAVSAGDFLEQDRIHLWPRGIAPLDDEPHFHAAPLDLQRDVARHRRGNPLGQGPQRDREAKAVPPKLGSLNDRGESLGAVCLAKKTPVQSIALIEDTDKRAGGQPAFSSAAAMPLRSVRMAAASSSEEEGQRAPGLVR